MSSSRLVEVGKDLTAGTMAGIAQLLVGHPFDTVKVKLQSQQMHTQDGTTTTTTVNYTGAWDAVKKIMASQGPKGLYRGLSAPLAAVALFNAVLFTARGQMDAFLSHHSHYNNNQAPHGLPYARSLSVPQQMVAGVGAGVAVSFVACPTELIKCRLQAQNSSTSSITSTAPTPPPLSAQLEEDARKASEQDKALQDHPNNNNSFESETVVLQDDIGLRTLVVNHQQVDPTVVVAAVDLEAPATTASRVEEQVEQLQQQQQPPSSCPLQAPPKYTGSLDVIAQIFRDEGGVWGFFKGLSPTLLREMLGNAAYFGSYQGTKQLLSKGGTGRGEDLSTASLLVAGGVAGAMFWLCVYPADVIKSMIQVDDYRHPKYTNVFDAFRKLFHSQGWKGFYCGFGPAMARSVFANAVCFYVYELVRQAFK